MVKRLGKNDSDDNHRADARDEKLGWNDLPDEIRHNVVAQALNDPDAWRAKGTFISLSGTDRRLHANMNTRAIQDFKEELSELEFVSKAVLTKIAPDNRFSNDEMRWNRRNFWSEVRALAPVLESMPPTTRTALFNNISERPLQERIKGYSCLVVRRDLFEKHQSDQMLNEALEVFRNTPASNHSGYTAAGIIAVGHDDISKNSRAEIRQLLVADVGKRIQFGEMVAQANPSLLDNAEIRNMVREDFRHYDCPYMAIAALASHIDKNVESETNFIIEKAMSYFGPESIDGNHNICGAAAIAKVSDGNLSDENKARINQLRQSDSEEGRELNAALERLRPAPSADLPQSARRAAQKLTLDLVRIASPADDIATIDAVIEVSRATERRMNSARRTLMDSVRDPHER